MFEAIEVGRKLEKAAFAAREPQLRVELVNAQFDLGQAPRAVVLLVTGDDRVGVNQVVDRLSAWMDARYLDIEVSLAPSTEERARPRYWRYWRALPPHGRTGVFVGGWVSTPITQRVTGEIDDAEFQRCMEHAARFERNLALNGAVVVKVFLHLSKKEHKKRLKRGKHDRQDCWWLEEVDEAIYEEYDALRALSERWILQTDVSEAPWTIVESGDERYRDMTVAEAVLRGLTAAAQAPAAPAPRVTPAVPVEGSIAGTLTQPTALSVVDLGATLDQDEYEERLARLQRKLNRLARKARKAPLGSVLAFEGWDAAGKGGVIRRVTGALPARDYRVHPISAPSDEERARHYLWRFWRRIPPMGRMEIFDRSWYGRVLVERVEGFAEEEEWRRAYSEINDFEAQLVERGLPVLKFWLHIDPDEQLRRFEARAKTPYKKYKLTPDDVRNRGRWGDYVAAVDEMVARTSTAAARWHLVAANDKRWARVQVLERVCAALEERLEG